MGEVARKADHRGETSSGEDPSKRGRMQNQQGHEYAWAENQPLIARDTFPAQVVVTSAAIMPAAATASATTT
jgi:hypothetical protein